MKQKQRNKKNRRGFTLIESAVSISILGALMLSVNLFMKPATDMWVLQAFRDGTQHEARLALMKMARELNQIKNDTSVLIAESSRIKFVNISNQEVDIRLSGTNLLRNDVVFARNVAELTLSYWGKDHAALGSPAVSPQKTNLYRIQALIRVEANGRSATLRSQVHPRNLYA